MLPLRRSVADLSLFCEKCLQPLRAEQALTKEQEAAVFSNWEVIRGVNQQLLDALSAPAPEDPLVRAAAAFESMAPWLKSYSVYSANFVTAQEKLDKLRSESAEVDKACGAVEALIQMSLGSMLIKPVQRLCKYPLLLRELLGALKPNSADRPALEAAAALVGAAADRVNADVRAAENAATMRRVAIEIDYTLPNNTPLLSPTRTLLHDADAEQLRIDEPELRGSHRRTPARLLLFSDGLLVAEPIREPIRGIRRSNGRGSLRARKWINLHHAKVSRDEGDAGGDEGGAYVFVGGDGDDEVFVLSGGTKAAVELVAAFDAAVGAHAAQVKASSNRFSMSRAGIPNFLRRRSGQGNLRRPS